MPSDHYEAYYADKLWALLPAIYRAEDSDDFDKPGPLRELVRRIGAQAAIVRRSIDRLWDDQSIESCDDWVIPYIADLLATNLVARLDARGQRLDVAKTIYYRRRKGTVAILEEIAADMTGWEARVVEFFRHMGRTRHGLDPAIGLPAERQFPDRLQLAEGLVGAHTRTGIGGWADLRNRYGAEKADTAFDEYFHFADFRLGREQTGWFNIPRLGVFLWRLESFGVDQTTPVPVTGCPNWFTFDPTGRDIPLFASASRRETRQYGDLWISPDEWQLPAPVSDGLWSAYPDQLYPPADVSIRSLAVYTLPGLLGYVQVDRKDVDVLPERGRFKVHNPPVSAAPFGVYHYGFSAPIGAGPYDRRIGGSQTAIPAGIAKVSGGGALNLTGSTRIDDSLTYSPNNPGTFQAALVVIGKNQKRPVIRMPAGFEWTFTGQPGAELTLDGLLISGGDILLAGSFESVTIRSCTLDPGSSGAPSAVFQKSADARDLTPTRIWIDGVVRSLVIERSIAGPIRTRGSGVLEELLVSDTILQGIPTSLPDALDAVDIKNGGSLASKLRDARTPLTAQLRSGFPPALKADLAAYTSDKAPTAALISSIVAALNTAIAGPSIFTQPLFADIPLSPATNALRATNPTGADLVKLNRLLLEEAFPMELADLAIGMEDGEVSLSRVTVLGRVHAHHIEASECILDDFAVAEDPQRGCIRFSAWTAGSILPKKYESVQVPAEAPIFTSRIYGEPGYGQLLASADSAILEGAQNGSEMGACSIARNAIKERSLRIKFEEFMPLGMVPVVIYVT